MIPPQFIDEVLSRVDLVDVIGARIELKRTGQRFSALCPFHDERSPSFSVNQDKQFYHCFGCKSSGNAIKFIMEFDRIDFPAAVKSLSESVGLKVPTEENADVNQHKKNRLYKILEEANLFYKTNLREHPKKQKAVAYLKRRSVTGEVARDFGLGYAPPGWNSLVAHLEQKEINLDEGTEAGVIGRKDNGHEFYDRFRDRVTFPILDIRGRVIGFGGRTLDDDGKPKYLNSPESLVFQKSNEIYGLYEVRKRSHRLDLIMVVDGYMDVVALSQNKIGFSVATLGTSINSQQIKAIFRTAPSIVFCFDGDLAGRNAASKALKASLPVMEDGLSAKFMFLPEGEDPDSLVRKEGKEKMLNRIQESKTLTEFFFDEIEPKESSKTPEGLAAAAKKAAPLINLLPKGVLREILINTLAEKTGIDSDMLQNRLGIEPTAPESLNQSQASVVNKIDQPFPLPKGKVLPLTQQAIEILIGFPELGANIEQSILNSLSADPETKPLFDLLVWTRDSEDVDRESALIYCREKLNQSPENLVPREMVLSLGELSREFEDVLKKITITQEGFRRSELLSNLSKKSLQELSEEEKRILSNSYKKPLR
ncbi:MAG: DNA primase [Pseudomonadota bacterium]|nr:DNA primase [Pseudomonadota bacterium]